MNLNIDKYVSLITPFFYIWLTLYFSNSILFFILPKVSVEYSPENRVLIDYKHYDMGALFKNQTTPFFKKSIKKTVLPTLSGFELVAIYAMADGNGWITIKNKSTQKTTTIQTGKRFKGYLLKSIMHNNALFENNGNIYKLEIKRKKQKFEIITKNDELSWKEKIIVDGNKIQIQRKFFDTPVNDFKKVWQSVDAKLIKNQPMSGYLLSKIAKDSMLLSLGLKQNDIINKINGITILGYEEIFNIYNKVKLLKKLNITVYRNNRLVELTYEIN